MVTAKTTICNPQGMHMRPAQLLVAAVISYPCDVTLRFDGKDVNAKSIMSLMAACLKQGSEVEVICDGEGEQDALKAAVGLIESGLGD